VKSRCELKQFPLASAAEAARKAGSAEAAKILQDLGESTCRQYIKPLPDAKLLN
jgi:hypothetical protein